MGDSFVITNSELISESLNRSADHINELRAEYGAQPGQSLQSAIINRREEGWRETEAALCQEVQDDIKSGVSPAAAYKDMLERAGFDPTTQLSCKPQEASLSELGGMALQATPDYNALAQQEIER